MDIPKDGNIGIHFSQYFFLSNLHKLARGCSYILWIGKLNNHMLLMVIKRCDKHFYSRFTSTGHIVHVWHTVLHRKYSSAGNFAAFKFQKLYLKIQEIFLLWRVKKRPYPKFLPHILFNLQYTLVIKWNRSAVE